MSAPGSMEWARALADRIHAEMQVVRAVRRAHGALWRRGDGGEGGPEFVLSDDGPGPGHGVVFALDPVVAGHVVRWSPSRAHRVLSGHLNAVRQYMDVLARLARLESAPGFDFSLLEETRVEVRALRWGLVSMVAEQYPEGVDGVTGLEADGSAQREDFAF